MSDVSLVGKRSEGMKKTHRPLAIGLKVRNSLILRDIDPRWLTGLVKYKNHRWSET